MLNKIVLSGIALCWFTSIILMMVDMSTNYVYHNLGALSGEFFCGVLVFMFVGALAFIWE